MTDLHARALWGYGSYQGLTLPGLRYPVAQAEATSAFLTASDPLRVRPYCFQWNRASDSFSVAYPAGTVAVFRGPTMTYGSSGTIDARIEAGMGSGQAVPGVLPVGYTANYWQEWTSINGADGSGGALEAWDINRRRTAAGWVASTWKPETASRVLGVSTSFSGAAVTNSFSPWDIPAIGYRKVQYRVGCSTSIGAGSFLTGAQFAGTFTVQLGHNANGSTSFVSIGDTTDHTRSIVLADFLAASGGSVFTDWIDAGAISPTLGTLTQFLGRCDSSGLSASPPGSSGWSVQLRLSPRCDVPFPNTVSGIGSLIAPGGYIP